MVASDYIPEKGDIVWLNFDPQIGHEQRGHRPAICVSHKIYNQKVGLALFCPITSSIKGYPFEVVLKQHETNGCILSDQIKNLDWRERDCTFIERAREEELTSVIDNIKLLID